MTWAKRPLKWRRHVLAVLDEMAKEQEELAAAPGDEGPRPHQEWAGTVRDAMGLLQAGGPIKPRFWWEKKP